MASQALVLAIARVANYALVFLSPLILVRMLSVEEFGRYREFLVYASVLVSFAGFSVTDSLLTFLPKYQANTVRVLDQTAQLVVFTSLTVVGAAVILDLATQGALFAGFVWPLAAYILLFINVDFWEWYWLATKRPLPVFLYTAGRLVARMATVVAAGALTHDVEAIVWSLVALEAVRLVGAAIFWRRMDRASEPRLPAGFRAEQWRFCLPWGFAVMVAIASRNIGNVAIVKMLGAAALAHYVIGLYGEPIVTTVRNSISSVLLPEMVRREATAPEDAIGLWRHALVINCIVMLPIAVVCVRHADSIIRIAFGPSYLEAAPVLQLFMLVVVRECFDLTLPFRARGHSVSFVRSGLVGLLANSVLLFALVPRLGIVGGVLAMIGGSYCEALYLGRSLRRFLGTGRHELLPWGAVGRTLLAALIALALLYSDRWLPMPPLAAAIVTLVLGALAYIAVLHFSRVHELAMLVQWGRRLVGTRRF